VTCGRRYTWTAGEQRFYREHNLAPPKNCPRHRRGRGYVPGGPPAPPLRPARRGGWKLPWGPIRVFGLGYFGLSAVLAIGLAYSLAMDGALAWLLAVNTASLSAFAYDKSAAVANRERVPEVVLLALTVAGGVVGAVAAMWSLRHKTAKGSFQVRIWLAAVVPASMIAAYVFGLGR
jgi:uncharacterized membrane protein YsdA (DUF1294 family)